MRFVRFVHPAGAAFGVVEGEQGAPLDALTVAEIEGHPFGEITFTGQRWALNDVRLLSPILPSKVVGVAGNYPAIAAEIGQSELTTPRIFLKPSTTVIGPNDAVRLPVDSKNTIHEVELAVVIGARGARNVKHDRALDSVFGYTVANDITAFDQLKSDGHFTRAKSHDSFCPIGPWIDTDFRPDGQELSCEVDGEMRQRDSIKSMTHDIATLISYVSHIMTLLPGDVLLTGTPQGTSALAGGNIMRATVEGIGTLVNPVVEKAAA
ncbi:MAG: fumarylacetoacetate hydrolase family protein [Corynebacteriales bacterium]|nr:fumarylacetoacetate hydrolase family protein [Mycobacteriales bacterium]